MKGIAIDFRTIKVCGENIISQINYRASLKEPIRSFVISETFEVNAPEIFNADEDNWETLAEEMANGISKFNHFSSIIEEIVKAMGGNKKCFGFMDFADFSNALYSTAERIESYKKSGGYSDILYALLDNITDNYIELVPKEESSFARINRVTKMLEDDDKKESHT